MKKILVGCMLAGLACLHVGTAAAQETPEAPSGTAPAAPVAPAPTVVVMAPPPPAPPPGGIVQTQRIDTVVVAEPGSKVSVHDSAPAPYAPDPARRGALIASSLGWGLGTLVLGVGYLSAHSSSSCSYDSTTYNSTCTQNPATDWLVAYDLNMAIVPSIPRWVVGDYTGALIFTALRGGSVVSASLIQGNDAFGPVVLGFLVPVTLGIVDFVFTPHRESLQHDSEPHVARTDSGFSLTSFGPAPITGPDRRVNGGALRLSASF
jgi:hypothetical protein